MTAEREPGPKDWITIGEFAKVLTCDRTTIYHYERRYPSAFPRPFRPLGPAGHPRWFRYQAEAFKRYVESQVAEPDVVDGERTREDPRAIGPAGRTSRPLSVDDVRP